MASGYIEMKQMILDEPIKLAILKSKFNRYASRLNVFGETLSDIERDDLFDRINELDKQIKEYK